MVTMLAKTVRRLACLIAEMNKAQRRAAVLATAADRFMPGRDSARAPSTYAEFMYRTSGVLLHEPAAAQRAHGQLVR
jgi:hypothetical protein